MKSKTIAIACQGGGSQTAFTAGVLKAFFNEGLDRKVRIAGLSGTSGGAVCAALAWEALLREDGHHRQTNFNGTATSGKPRDTRPGARGPRPSVSMRRSRGIVSWNDGTIGEQEEHR